MPKAEVNEERIVLSEYGDRSREWWDMLLNRLKSLHVPGRYQYGRRMWAAFGTAMIYFTSDTVSVDDAVAILEQTGFDVRRQPD